MKRIILSLTMVIFTNVVARCQENRLSLGVGYPINLTNHWLIEKWTNPFNVDIRYIHSNNLLIAGFGLSFSKYDIDWFRDHVKGDGRITDFNPHLLFGLNIGKKVVTFLPYFDVGYSKIFTNIDIYNGGNGGISAGLGLDCNFRITKKIKLGLGIFFKLIKSAIDFDYQGNITKDFPLVKDENTKSLPLNLNLSYRLK